MEVDWRGPSFPPQAFTWVGLWPAEALDTLAI